MTLNILLHFMAESLAYIINLSIQQSTRPKVLKSVEVIPMYKTGNKKAVLNYRLISLLSNIAKLFE